MVDIFDAKTKQAIWHCNAIAALSDNERSNAEAAEQAIDRMFRALAPSSDLASEQ